MGKIILNKCLLFDKHILKNFKENQNDFDGSLSNLMLPGLNHNGHISDKELIHSFWSFLSNRQPFIET